MMKKVMIAILCLAFLFCSCAVSGCNFASVKSVTPAFDWKPLFDDTTWSQETYANMTEGQDYIYILRNSDHSCINGDVFQDYKQMKNTYFALLLNSAEPVSSIGSRLPDLSFVIKTDDKQIYHGAFYQNGISIQNPEGKTVLLAINQQDYDKIRKKIADNFSTGIVWIPQFRLQEKQYAKATFTSSDGKSNKIYTSNNIPSWVFMNMQIVAKSAKSVKENAVLNGAVKLHLEFSDNSYYDVQVNQNDVILYDSSTKHAVQYQSYSPSDSFQDFDMLSQGHTPAPNTGKPVIYLYPEKPTDVTVLLNFKGQLANTEPTYNGGWHVTAYPGGQIVNNADGKVYPYLFWDGYSHVKWNYQSGFCVAGKDSEQFLRTILPKTGLNPAETEAFIAYWLPHLQQNTYNLITFSAQQYEQLAPLTIIPVPDSLLRVHMVFRPVSGPVAIAPQSFAPFVRKGFTVVEWGGTKDLGD